jgi:hypothetical protein
MSGLFYWPSVRSAATISGNQKEKSRCGLSIRIGNTPSRKAQEQLSNRCNDRNGRAMASAGARMNFGGRDERLRDKRRDVRRNS